MKTIMRKVLVAAVLAGVSGGVLAANDGGLGNAAGTTDGSSEGDFDIEFKQSALTRIWGMEDVILTPGSESNNAQDVCVYSNADTSGSYSLTVASGNAGNLFKLIDTVGGNSDNIPYTITLTHGSATLTADQDNTGPVNATDFDAGTLASQPNPGTVASPTNGCAGNENLNIAIAITTPTPGGAVRVQDGTYTDRITLTVSPL